MSCYGDVDCTLLEFALKAAEKMGCSYADVRFGVSRGTVVEVKNGEVEKTASGVESGVGVRVLFGGVWGFASSNSEMDRERMQALVESAVKTARARESAGSEEKTDVAHGETGKGNVFWSVKKPPMDVSPEEKVSLVLEADRVAREDSVIKSVTTVYSDGVDATSVFSTHGDEVYSEVTRTVIQSHVIARDGELVTSYRFRIGGTMGFEIFDEEDPTSRARDAVESVKRILGAKSPPGGKMTVIADPRLTGVFIHEALGHASEGDLVSAGGSVLRGLLGKEIASPLVSVYDDPTLRGLFGSFPFDDEGTPSRKKTIIENGVLVGYLLDRESAHRLSLEPNGSARAQSYAHVPQVRMSNTYVGKGDMSFDELVEDIKIGIYALGTRGGEVNPTLGTFQFGAQESFLIEDGEVKEPLRDVAISGNILQTLKDIDGVGKDLVIGDPGFCGKGGQMVPVGDGGPHIRIRNVVVGGRG